MAVIRFHIWFQIHSSARFVFILDTSSRTRGPLWNSPKSASKQQTFCAKLLQLPIKSVSLLGDWALMLVFSGNTSVGNGWDHPIHGPSCSLLRGRNNDDNESPVQSRRSFFRLSHFRWISNSPAGQKVSLKTDSLLWDMAATGFGCQVAFLLFQFRFERKHFFANYDGTYELITVLASVSTWLLDGTAVWVKFSHHPERDYSIHSNDRRCDVTGTGSVVRSRGIGQLGGIVSLFVSSYKITLLFSGLISAHKVLGSTLIHHCIGYVFFFFTY